MNPNENCIAYEVKICGLDPTDTVKTRRKILLCNVAPCPHEGDVIKLKMSLYDLRNKVNNFVGELYDAAYRRIVSRFTHMSKKLHRLNTKYFSLIEFLRYLPVTRAVTSLLVMSSKSS